MASKNHTGKRNASNSWIALLAATTLGGSGGAETVQAEVKAEGLEEAGLYRLVVQSYDALGEDLSRAKPVGSMQRAVTAEELREGVCVNLLELRTSEAPSKPGTVVAWVEVGSPDLEFDARRARPTGSSLMGQARMRDRVQGVRIRLERPGEQAA
jgi:hypothetical protein